MNNPPPLIETVHRVRIPGLAEPVELTTTECRALHEALTNLLHPPRAAKEKPKGEKP